VSFYLDASVLVSFFVSDAHSPAADAWIDRAPNDIVVSDFAKVEFAAVMSRLVRMGAIDHSAANEALTDCDLWTASATRSVRLQSRDVALADRLVRDFTTLLAAPDALHLAIASNRGHTLITFDQRLADAARMRGAPVATPG
jgi:predicted nucleic acid-binding protein